VADQFDEIWENLPDGQALCALINADRGWLMYLRENGDSGFTSRNPDYYGPKDATIEYVLSNGQHDLYPASWALPISVIRLALEHFRQKHERPPFVTWHED
jgi:Immunity protein Imm1